MGTSAYIFNKLKIEDKEDKEEEEGETLHKTITTRKLRLKKASYF